MVSGNGGFLINTNFNKYKYNFNKYKYKIFAWFDNLDNLILK